MTQRSLHLARLPHIAPAGRLAAGLLVLVLALVTTVAAGAREATDVPLADGQASPLAALDATARAALDTPLAPAPTASPQQTFASFRILAQRAANTLMDAIERSANNDAVLDTPELHALKQEALDHLAKAASTLDLSGHPPASRRTVGISSVLLLEEIMDRIDLPALDGIPDAGAVEAGAALNGWAIPQTEIRMTRTEGPGGEPCFLFSEETVRRLPEFYARVRDLPRRSTEEIDFYQSFVAGPGLSMPIEFYRHVLGFPQWMLRTYHEQAVWQWLAFATVTGLAGLFLFLVLRWDGRRAQPVNPASRGLQRLIFPLLVVALLSVYRWLNDDVVNLTGNVLAGVELVVVVLQALALAAIAVLAFNAMAMMIIAMPRVRKESLDASLIRLILRFIGIVVAGYILSVGAARVGVPLYGIIASLGVGGLALALAVRPTLENFIGGIILYADRPVKVGDFCKFGGMLGTVEMIGLRSTKIRGLDRTLVTVQNADFARMSITNFSRRDSNLMHTTIRLRYETTQEQLQAVLDGIAAMLRTDERVDAESVRVCLRGLGDYAFEIEIWAYVMCPDWGPFLKIQEDLFMNVIGVVQDSGTAFAFPSHTTYLGTDHHPDSSKEAPALAGLLQHDRPLSSSRAPARTV